MFHEEGCNYADSSSAVRTLNNGMNANQIFASDGTTEHVHKDLRHKAVSEPYVSICRGVWCGDGTHYVQVNVSQSMGPDSAIQQVDEDRTVTVEEFLRMEFSHTEAYEDTFRKIRELNKRCCRPIQDTIIPRATEHRSSNARTNPIHSSYNLVGSWLQSCFSACIPKTRKFSRWPSSTCPRRPVLPPNTSYPSTEAIIADTGHRPILEAVKYYEKSHSEEALEYRTSTADMPPPTPTASAQMLTQAPRPNHSAICKLSADATRIFLPESVIGVVAVEAFYSTCKGVIGCGVLGMTRSDSIVHLKSVDLGALIERERIARQLQCFVGKLAYAELLRFEYKRSCVPEPVYHGILPEMLPIGVGEEISLQECSPLIQAQVDSLLNS